MGSASILSSLGRRLEGKVALITGGASDIGASTAELFIRYGARVIVDDVQDDKGRSLCNAIGPAANIASYVHCDVTDESDMKHAVDTAIATHGKLDIMFSNAGTTEDDLHEDILRCKKPVFERVMFLATKHAAGAMVSARRGSIVITARAASGIGGAMPPAYTCSKHAVVGLMRSAAAELGKHGVRVNYMSPYGLATPLTTGVYEMDEEALEALMEKFGNLKGVRLKAEDVAEAVAYLGGDESRYVSGVNLMVDGGFTISKSLE